MNSIEKLFRKLNPEYRHRWEVYEELLNNSLTKETVWLDIGCGKNEIITDHGHKAKIALGIDIGIEKGINKTPFLIASFDKIPLASASVDLITLRLVVEHMEYIPNDFFEAIRVLKSGGKLIILTTNSHSPLIFVPRILPYDLKKWIIQKSFGIHEDDIFPTYHRFNTIKKMKAGLPRLKLLSVSCLEQVPLNKPVLALLFGIWYAISKIFRLQMYRSNLLAVFQKLDS